MMESDLTPYEDLWKDGASHYLIVYDPKAGVDASATIFDLRGPGPLVVETDDATYAEIIRRMRDAGVPVMAYDEPKSG